MYRTVVSSGGRVVIPGPVREGLGGLFLCCGFGWRVLFLSLVGGSLREVLSRLALELVGRVLRGLGRQVIGLEGFSRAWALRFDWRGCV